MELCERIDGRETLGLSDRDLHRILADERRRRALVHIGNLPTPVDLRTLADEMLEQASGRDDHTEGDVHALMVELYHQHLPMLDDVGVIELDESGKQIEACRLRITEY